MPIAYQQPLLHQRSAELGRLATPPVLQIYDCRSMSDEAVRFLGALLGRQLTCWVGRFGSSSSRAGCGHAVLSYPAAFPMAHGL